MPDTRCPIIYDKNDLLVIHKPSGVLSHPNQPGSRQSCAFEGAYDFNDRRFDTPAGPVWLIHRLDQDTSGILLATRTKSAAKSLRAAFEENKVRKIYLALILGLVKPSQGQWNDFIKTENRGNRLFSRAIPSQRPNAQARYWLQNYYPGLKLSLLRVELQTGKTHQIRIQSASRQHPVAGDDVYGDFQANKALRKSVGLRHIFLHAYQAELRHPVTGKPLFIEDDLPEDLQEIVDEKLY